MVEVLKNGGVIIYPTDTIYAIGCDINNVKAIQRVCQLKGIKPEKANFSMICRDLSNIAAYAKVNNEVFKVMKRNLPGPYTFYFAGDYQIAECDDEPEKNYWNTYSG